MKKTTEQILEEIRESISCQVSGFVGTEVKPQTPDEIAEILQKNLRKFIRNPEVEIIVTPTDDDKILNVSFIPPKYTFIDRPINFPKDKEGLDEE